MFTYIAPIICVGLMACSINEDERAPPRINGVADLGETSHDGGQITTADSLIADALVTNADARVTDIVSMDQDDIDGDVDLAGSEPADSGHIFDFATAKDAALPADRQLPMSDADVTETPSLASRIQDVISNAGLGSMRMRLPISEIEEQTMSFGGTVDFVSALGLAIESFLNDGTDEESPRRLAAEVRTGPCLNEDLRERVRCFLNRETAYLELYGSQGFAPEEGEPVAQNWIFILRAESLSDHITWAIVDRTGTQPTYNYGFN